MAFKYSISFVTIFILAANFGYNQVRITPEIVSKLLLTAIWSGFAILLESEILRRWPFLTGTPFSSDALYQIWFGRCRNVSTPYFYSGTSEWSEYWARDECSFQWEKNSGELYWKFHFTWEKNKFSLPKHGLATQAVPECCPKSPDSLLSSILAFKKNWNSTQFSAGHLSLRKVTSLGPNLASVTDLKRIETPRSLCCDFGGYKTFTTCWSGGTVQVWVQVRAPAGHLAIFPKAVPEGNRRFREQSTAKLFGPLSGSACAGRTGEHKHRAFPSQWQSLRAATGSLEELKSQ